MKLEIKELRHFRDAVRRDVLVDLQGRPLVAGDAEVLMKLIDYGNNFLERERLLPSNQDCAIWFDIFFGEPAKIGVTWAFNPYAPTHKRYGTSYFWLMWSETDAGDELLSLTQAQEEMAEYLFQHHTK